MTEYYSNLFNIYRKTHIICTKEITRSWDGWLCFLLVQTPLLYQYQMAIFQLWYSWNSHDQHSEQLKTFLLGRAYMYIASSARPWLLYTVTAGEQNRIVSCENLGSWEFERLV